MRDKLYRESFARRVRELELHFYPERGVREVGGDRVGSTWQRVRGGASERERRGCARRSAWAAWALAGPVGSWAGVASVQVVRCGCVFLFSFLIKSFIFNRGKQTTE